MIARLCIETRLKFADAMPMTYRYWAKEIVKCRLRTLVAMASLSELEVQKARGGKEA